MTGNPSLHKESEFQSFDGTSIVYRDNEIEDGPCLLFLQGLVCTDLHWKYQRDYFARKTRVLSLDYRGHGVSSMPQDLSTLTIRGLARDAASLLHHLGIRKAVVLGHSMGVNVALDLWHILPEKVSALVLANGTARTPFESVVRGNLVGSTLPYLNKLYRARPDFLNSLWRSQAQSDLTHFVVRTAGFHPAFSRQEDVLHYIEQASQVDLGVALSLIESYHQYNALPWLHEINVPCLILAGEKDLVVPRAAQEQMAQLIPRSRLEVIPEGSHCPEMDIPASVNVAIDRFLLGVLKAKAINHPTIAPAMDSA